MGQRACSLYYACVAASFKICITPVTVWQQACGFVLGLCGGEKEKKERRKIFVACVAVSLRLVVLYYACGEASL